MYKNNQYFLEEHLNLSFISCSLDLTLRNEPDQLRTDQCFGFGILNTLN